jgi:DNA polymerase-1
VTSDVALDPRPPTLLLVDGHAYAYRAFHAIRGLRSPDGRPTNAVFGFIKMVGRLLGSDGCRVKRESPSTLDPRPSARFTHAAVIWDGGLAAERVVALPQYKAQRPPMPEGLAEQLDGMVAWLKAAGIASFCRDGVEADDWIATLARQAERADWAVVIASSDKDFMQLVSLQESDKWRVTSDRNIPSRVTGHASLVTGDEGGADGSRHASRATRHGGWIGLLNPGDKTETAWSAEHVRNKTGVAPSQVVDWLSLVGDSVDNIPGVPGVGPKTAADLLGQFGSVAGLYGRLAEVKWERVRTALAAAAADVSRNQALVRLKTDVAGAFSPEELAVRAPATDTLRELYASWGFRSLLAELGPAAPAQACLL